MKLLRMPLGALGTNCYIVVDETSKRALVVDPGGEGERVLEIVKKEELVLDKVILTHGHADHIGGVQTIIDEIPCDVYIAKGDEPFLTDGDLNLSAFMGQSITVKKKPVLIQENDIITCGDISFKVIETPGHTPGGVCFYGHGIVLAGDTLFQGSVGRTDFPQGSMQQLITGIKEKLFVLPDETVVYPGHGPETTIGEEKRGNPFIR